MATNKQKLFFCFIVLNVTVVIVNFTGVGGNLWDYSKKMSARTLTALKAPKDSQSFLRGSHKPANLDPSHPFNQLSNRLEQLEWDAKRIDEAILKFWETEKTFLRHEVDEKTQQNHTFLSTSCLHTAAWIVVGLLELQKRPNYYYGLYKVPKDKDLIVYDNTDDLPSTSAAPVIQSLKSFIDSRPSNESIILQVDMYQLQDEPSNYYMDHHFALHVYDGQISLYHSWQNIFNLIDWMKTPGPFKLRYPMPVDTFFALLETSLTYTEEENERRKRLEATWKLFGITDTFTYGSKEVLDPVVRRLRYPWVVSLVTHWPDPQAQDDGVKE